jgi:hypothetical protein
MEIDLGYGPKLLASVGRKGVVTRWPLFLAQAKEEGFLPFAADFRTHECWFVSPSSLVSPAHRTD